MIGLAIAWVFAAALGWWLWAVDWKHTFGSVALGEALLTGAICLACPPAAVVVGLGFLAFRKGSRLNDIMSRKVL